MKIDSAFLKSTQSAYSKIAVLEIENDHLVIRNKMTGCYHLFVDGREKIPLSAFDKKVCSKFLQNTIKN